MKFLLIGDYKDNGGPTNVNRELIDNSDNYLYYIKYDNKFFKFVETLLKILFSKVVIISGYTNNSMFFNSFAHIFGKKSIYIMHGCVKYENSINKLNLEQKYVDSEYLFLNSVDLILCVSEKYSLWVKNFYPNIKTKISYLNNGIPFIKNVKKQNHSKKSYIISLIGGNRNIKNNKIVCQAISDLVKEGYSIEAYLYGRIYDNNETINFNSVKYKGMIPHDELIRMLQKTNLYICNSLVESFGLSVIDALESGCDILINKNTGASSIFSTEPMDLIDNISDVEEIKSKIIYIMKHSNNQRIVKTISNNSDYKSSCKKLLNICKDIYYGGKNA